MCNFVRSAAYCFMDAESNRAKGPEPREDKQMEGLDLESVIERARGHDAEALGRSIAAMFGAYSACAVTCWTHERGQKMLPAKSSSATAFHQKLRRFDTVSKLAAAGGWQPMH